MNNNFLSDFVNQDICHNLFMQMSDSCPGIGVLLSTVRYVRTEDLPNMKLTLYKRAFSRFEI